MVDNIIIIQCSNSKKSQQTKASELYTSERFNLSKKIAEKYAKTWFILSAKHGLIEPDKLVTPYDRTITDFSVDEKKEFISNVINQITKLELTNKRLIFLTDPDYTDEIVNFLKNTCSDIISPFSQIKREMWINYLNQLLDSERIKALDRLYDMLFLYENKMGGIFQFKELGNDKLIPKRGVYIFFSENEKRLFSTKFNRIVRVGTHAVSQGSKSTLYNRLKTHKGKSNFDGNHRSSIFRLHVGNAIMNKQNITCDSWGKDFPVTEALKKQELEIEKEVSNYIGEMPVLLINIDDKVSKYSDRSYIEQNLIALISGKYYPLDFQNQSWLGNFSVNDSVRKSSLWNVDYTDKWYQQDFLDVLEIHLKISAGETINLHKSFAPANWHLLSKNNYIQNAINF